MVNIIINTYDKRNNVYSVSIPFIRYQKPELKLVSVEGSYMLVDDTYVIFGKTTFNFEASSPIGLSKIVYKINDQEEKVINLNGEKKYTFSIVIE